MPTTANTLKKTFNAKNNAINFLAVYVDGRQVPAKPLQPNFETGSYIRSYVNLISATGKQAQDEGTICRAMTLVKATPSSASIYPPTVATVVVFI